MSVDLKTIVKPKKPMVWNVTQNQDTNQVVIHIRTLYQEDYLTVQNQFFQVVLWNASAKMVFNLTSPDTLALDRDHLKGDAQYHAKARSIPHGRLRGTWSDWSDTFTFYTAAHHSQSGPEPGPSGSGSWWPVLVCVALSLTTVLAIFLFWKQKVYRLMWPQIPKPPPVDIRASARGLLLHFTPEKFSLPMLEKQHSTIHSSGCGNKEQLHLSSHGSRDDPSFGVEGAEMSGASSKEDAYVTMSSIYQVQ
ncbi:interleukin-7 receptor subunit alpha [Synchiropus picturatus]